MTVAGVSKLVFIALILVYGRPFLGHAGVPIAIDLVMVGLFAAFLVGVRRRS